MVNISLDHWYVTDNKMSISLMTCFVMIDLVPNQETKKYELIVFLEGKENMRFYFDTIENAISFTENTLSKRVDFDALRNTQSSDNRRKFEKVKTNKINQKLR